MKPIDSVHLLDESPLTDHRSDQVKREYRRITPVSGHHLPDGELLWSKASGWKIFDTLLNYLSDVMD